MYGRLRAYVARSPGWTDLLCSARLVDGLHARDDIRLVVAKHDSGASTAGSTFVTLRYGRHASSFSISGSLAERIFGVIYFGGTVRPWAFLVAAITCGTLVVPAIAKVTT